MLQAGVRRPRGVVWRPDRCRRSSRFTPRRGIFRGQATPRESRGIARNSAWIAGRTHTAASFCGDDPPPVLLATRTPCIWRWPITSVTSCRLQRAEAGFRTHPLFHRLDSAWGLAPNLCGSSRVCPTASKPSRRPRTTLSPTLVLRDGHPYLAFGTPGGDQQDQWTLLFFLYHAEFGCDLQAATDGPTFHSDHAWTSFAPRSRRPGILTMEDRYDTSVVAQLRDAGHTVELAEPWSAGWTTAVARDSSGFLRAGASSRRGFECYAVGR